MIAEARFSEQVLQVKCQLLSLHEKDTLRRCELSLEEQDHPTAPIVQGGADVRSPDYNSQVLFFPGSGERILKSTIVGI